VAGPAVRHSIAAERLTGDRHDRLAASHGITIECVMTDNHRSYKNSTRLAELISGIGAKHKFIRPHCPWQNGKVERFNRILQTEWAYRQVFESKNAKSAALPDFLDRYNHHRRHHAPRRSPTRQPTVTNLTTEYN
jgi:transposase InsO family protein